MGLSEIMAVNERCDQDADGNDLQKPRIEKRNGNRLLYNRKQYISGDLDIFSSWPFRNIKKNQEEI